MKAPRRPGPDVLLAVVLPLACALALLLLRPDQEQPGAEPPVEAPLTSASVVCPATIAGSGEDVVGVTTLAAALEDKLRGEVEVGLGESTAPLELRGGRVAAAAPGDGAAVVSGAGELAPGLVAGRTRTSPLAAVDCTPPRASQWFTAVGADATHDSVIELVNPNAGPAIADVVVRSPGGVLDVPQLRGVSVPGGTSLSLDLGQVVPRRGELSISVETSRGRLSVQVVDTYDELGAGTRAQEWLPAQPEPATSNLLLGLASGAGERTLVLANPGGDEVRAEIKVVTPTSTFAPVGVEPVRVAPDSTESVSLDDVLQQAAQQGATGLLIESTGPVTATVRQFVEGDLSLLAPLSPIGAATGLVVPPGVQRLLLAGPESVGVATVATYAANGKALDSQRVELAPGTGADIALPGRTALVTVTPERTTVRAAVLVEAVAPATGATVVPLRELLLTSLVPGVRPGLP